MNRALRTIIIAIPVVLLAISWVVHLCTTALRSGIYRVFKKSNYWDLGNEWFQVKQEASEWYEIWRDGTGWK